MTNGSFGGSGRRLVFYSDFGGRLATWPNEIADGAWTYVSGVRNTANFSMSISVNGAARVTNTYGSLPNFTPIDAWMISRFPKLFTAVCCGSYTTNVLSSIT
jgi:hypothetical protein